MWVITLKKGSRTRCRVACHAALNSYYRYGVVSFPGGEVYSASVWDRWLHSIVRNLGSYWFVAVFLDSMYWSSLPNSSSVCGKVDMRLIVGRPWPSMGCFARYCCCYYHYHYYYFYQHSGGNNNYQLNFINCRWQNK